MAFLKKELAAIDEVKNIFIYFHQVLWWSPDNQFSKLRLNLKVGRDPDLNFWKELMPLFQKTQKPVYLFAGDVGGASWADDCFYGKSENVHMIASGMGDGKGDNFLMIGVDKNKQVEIRLIALGMETTDALGDFENYCKLTPPSSERKVKPKPLKKKERLSLKVSQDRIFYNDIPFKSSRQKMEELMGKPDSIVEPKYECGLFSEDWQDMKFFQYFYAEMNFIVYGDTAEVQEITFEKTGKLRINNILLSKGMDFLEVAKQLDIPIPEDPDQGQITLLPEGFEDEYYYLNFKNGKLFSFDRYEPC